jgi:hypothetical protein
VLDYYIKTLDKENNVLWDEFNKRTEGGTFFHTSKWKDVLEKSFGYKMHYILVYDNDKVISICPFCENVIKGFKGLTYIPNSDYHHILIQEQKCNDLLTRTILDKGKDISKKNKLSFILITTTSTKIKDYFMKYNPLPFPESGNMVLNLKENTPTKIWEVIFTEKGRGTPRKYINRFEREGIDIREVTEVDDLKIFYKYYEENLRYKNVNPYPFSHFKYCWDSYSPSDMRITMVEKNHNIFGGLLAFIYHPKKTMYLKYLALNRNISNKYHPPFYLYWDAVTTASAMNLDYVCFGATPNDINNFNYRIKMKFGAEYEKEYRIVIPLSKLFTLSYKTYDLIKR